MISTKMIRGLVPRDLGERLEAVDRGDDFITLFL